MSRLQFLTRAAIPIFSIGQNGTNVGAQSGAGTMLRNDGGDTLGSGVVVPESGSDEQTWFIIHVPSSAEDDNQDPQFVIQHSKSGLWAFVPQTPKAGDAILATPSTATIWRVQFLAGGHIIYPSTSPALFWSLSSNAPGTQVLLALQTNTSAVSQQTMGSKDILWSFDRNHPMGAVP